jgi:hypothetical protein
VYSAYQAITGNAAFCWVAFSVGAGFNTVTIVNTTPPGSGGSAFVSIQESSNISAVDVYNTSAWTAGNANNASVTTTHAADLLHLFGIALDTIPVGPTGWYPRTTNILTATFDLNTVVTGTYSATVTAALPRTYVFCAVVALTLIIPESPVPNPGSAWLVIDDGPGYTDRTGYLSFSEEHEQHSFSQEIGKRSTAKVPLRIMAGDSYLSTVTDLNDIVGVQVFLYDQTSSGAVALFCGTVDSVDVTWDGQEGYRICTLTLVSFEQCFDVIYPTPIPYGPYINQTCGSIVRQLIATYATAAPVVIGIVQDGPTIPAFYIDGRTRLSDMIKNLATQANFISGVYPASQSFYFCAPNAIGAPFTLDANTPVVWETFKLTFNRQDFRDRQMLDASYIAFSDSAQLFAGNNTGGQQFYVNAPVDSITGAFQLKNTQNTAHGTFSGQPSPGDSITIGDQLPSWAPTTLYGDPSAIIDSNGHQQVIGSGYSGTQFGTSGGSAPPWNKTGGLTPDGSCVWLDIGPTLAAYTFVTSLDNRQWGQVIIGTTVAQTLYNLVDAINCNLATRGSAFSYPTWEHFVVNAGVASGTQINVNAKQSGVSPNAGLYSNCPNFTWSATHMSGGTSPGGVVSLSSGLAGIDASAQVLYTQGSRTIVTAPFYAVPNGWSIQINYQRVAGNLVVCEDTALVMQRAAIENGSGEFHQVTSDTSVANAAQLLQECQGALAAFSTIPQELDLDIFQPGLLPGQAITVNLPDYPAGIAALINTAPGPPAIGWIILEIDAKFIPKKPWMGIPDVGPTGHFQFSFKLINFSQIGTWLDFWEGLGGGGGSGSGISGAVSGNNGGGGSSSLIVPYGVPVIAGIATPDASKGFNLLILTTMTGNVTIIKPINYTTSIGDFSPWSLTVQQDPSGATGGWIATMDGSYFTNANVITNPVTSLNSTECVLTLKTNTDGLTNENGGRVSDQPLLT